MKYIVSFVASLSLSCGVACASGLNGPTTVVEITPGTLTVGAHVVCSWKQFGEILSQDAVDTTVVWDVAKNVETSILVRAKKEAKALGFQHFVITSLERRRKFVSSIPGPLFSGCPKQSGEVSD